MADSTTTVRNLGALSSLTQSTSTSTKASNEEVTKNEFLHLLVTQLKYQDPLDPMKNEDFAVNLAQFSQLEQLISIKDSLEGGNDLSSLTSYLGHEVTLQTSIAHVSGGDAGSAVFSLLSDSSATRLELVNNQGRTVKTIELGDLATGRHSIPLNNLTDVENGYYELRLSGTTTTGDTLNTAVYSAGTVTGVIPGANPTLIIGGLEVSPSDIREVNISSQG